MQFGIRVTFKECVHQHCPTLKPYVPNLNGLQVIVLGGSTSTMLGKLGVAEAAHGNNLDADVSSQPSMCTHLAVGSCNTSQVCITEENCTCYSAKCFGCHVVRRCSASLISKLRSQ